MDDVTQFINALPDDLGLSIVLLVLLMREIAASNKCSDEHKSDLREIASMKKPLQKPTQDATD